MIYKSISFSQKFGLFAEHWKPKVVAEMNEYQFKIVKLKGDFVWHEQQGYGRDVYRDGRRSANRFSRRRCSRLER